MLCVPGKVPFELLGLLEVRLDEQCNTRLYEMGVLCAETYMYKFVLVLLIYRSVPIVHFSVKCTLVVELPK